MGCHLLGAKLLSEPMLTKTCHHMASLAHNVSNGHLIRNLHISSVLWPLCISCFNTGDVLHKEWCPTTDYHLHQDGPLQVSSFQTFTYHLLIYICYLGAKSNIILFSLTRKDASGLQTAPGGGGKVGITQFWGMTKTSDFILVADIFRLENANIWQTTFSNGFSLMKWFPCWFKEDFFPRVQLTSQH